MSIATNTALFSLLGTIYDGDGRTTFGLPDLRGRFPMHPGTGPGLRPRRTGDRGGVETVALNQSQLPTHIHTIGVSSAVGDAKTPAGNVISQSNDGENNFSSAASDGAFSTSDAGMSQEHDNMPPFLAVNFIIALTGIFPTRS